MTEKLSQMTKSSVSADSQVIGRWNWGAASFTWIWGIRFKVWLAFLVFVPVVGQIWWIVMGLNGNEWAKKQNPKLSPEELSAQMRPWNTWGKFFFVAYIIFIIGYIALLSGLGFSSLNSARGLADDAKRKSDVSSLRVGVVLYHDDHQSMYPNTLADIGSQYVTIPQPPLAGETYDYVVSADHKHFLVYTKLMKDKKYYYVNDEGAETEQSAVPTCSITCP